MKFLELWLLAMTAVGTIALAVVTAVLATRDFRLRKQQQEEAAQVASILLWPILRKYLSSIENLQKEHYLDPQNAVRPDKDKAKRSLFYLEEAYAKPLELIKDMEPRYRHCGLSVLSNLSHAHRHITEILQEFDYASPERLKSKKIAARKALSSARELIRPLIAHCKSVMDKAQVGGIH
ncbi:MAG TPA: hypothetical protein DD803_16620 [Alcaligenes faecalis]|nr:hypothetical protein [Alcaligenes faecalis]HBQ91062.1 hypothetical protein [Alcaligenes faecalis]